MQINNRSYHRFGLLTATLTCLIGGSLSVSAQDSNKSTFDKWLPKVGVYSRPGKNFDQQCGEFGDLVLELDRKKVGGMEWTCKVTKITDRGPDALRLNLICEDDEMVDDVDSNPDPDKRKFKEVVTRRNEVMTLRRSDDNSVSWNVTKNGKFEGREWRSAYCATKWQRSFFEARAQADAEAKQKAATPSSEPERTKWPQP